MFAIGDVIDRVQLTPVAIAEAMNLVENMFRKTKKLFHYNNIPTAVFSNPNYAFVGLTEADARRNIKKLKFLQAHLDLLNFLSRLNEKVFVPKLIVNKLNDKILGLHYLGENAAEIIQGFLLQ